MSFFEDAANRTTGFGIVVLLWAVPGFVLGLILLISSGEPLALCATAAGPLGALCVMTPLRFLLVKIAEIPVVGFLTLPISISYKVFANSSIWLALRKRWIVELG